MFQEYTGSKKIAENYPSKKRSREGFFAVSALWIEGNVQTDCHFEKRKQNKKCPSCFYIFGHILFFSPKACVLSFCLSFLRPPHVLDCPAMLPPFSAFVRPSLVERSLCQMLVMVHNCEKPTSVSSSGVKIKLTNLIFCHSHDPTVVLS